MDTHSERYRSGHNEAVLKTVCPKGRVGSNPTLSVRFQQIVLRSMAVDGILQIQSRDCHIGKCESAHGEVPKMAEGTPLERVQVVNSGARVQIPPSPPSSRGGSGTLYQQSAIVGVISRRGSGRWSCPSQVALTSGSCAMGIREPGQGRNTAALSESSHVT